MLAGLDSAYAPPAGVIAQEYALGRRVWAGYFAGPNILHGWSQADFAAIKAGGMSTFAYCSGWADPAAMRAQSDAWQVPICLDVEGLIRSDGNWVQGWLDAASSGLYGNAGVFRNRSAAFYVIAAYPGVDPGATWPSYMTRPTDGPCGWQWNGSHAEFGFNVDSSWLDDAFLQVFGPGGGTIPGMAGVDPVRLQQLLADLYPQSADPAPRGRLAWLLGGDSDDQTPPVPPGSLTQAQAKSLDHIETMLTGGLKGT